MQKLDLKDLLPPWEHKFVDSMRETEFERLLGSDMHIPDPPGQKSLLGYRRAIAQDVFSALILRQTGGTKIF